MELKDASVTETRRLIMAGQRRAEERGETTGSSCCLGLLSGAQIALPRLPFPSSGFEDAVHGGGGARGGTRRGTDTSARGSRARASSNQRAAGTVVVSCSVYCNMVVLLAADKTAPCAALTAFSPWFSHCAHSV